MIVRFVVYLAISIGLWFPILCRASVQEAYIIVIRGHQFVPASLTIPAGLKIKLTVDNQDPTAEEFESFDLNREKVVSGNKKILIFIGPLKQGVYKYFGDFHQKTAQGTIVVQL